MRSKRTIGLAAVIVLVPALVVACRDFSDGPSVNRAGASGAVNGGQLTDVTEGGEPTLGASGGDANAAGKSNVGVAAGLGGVALPETRDGGAGGVAGAAVGAPLELLPADFPSLVLWLEASEDFCMIDVNEEVSGCHDRSGLGNDALERLPYSRPTFSRPAALGHAALRFEPVVRPDGNYPCRLGVADNRSLEFGTEDFAYVLVMNWSNDPKTVLSGTMPLYDGSGGILSKQNSIYPYAGVFLMANFPSYYVSPDATTPFAVQLSLAGPLAVSYSDGLNDEVFRVYTLRRKHTDLALRINATREGGVKLKSSVDVSGQGGDLLFGGVVGQPLRGEIAEIVALRGDFSDEQLVALERHLMSKYLLQ